MTPRLAALRADDAVASHRAVDGAGPSIKAARTYAHGTSTGAVTAVSCFRSVISEDHHIVPRPTAVLTEQKPQQGSQVFQRKISRGALRIDGKLAQR